MKNALILHGAGNSHEGNWFPWLKNELEKKGFMVWVPDLPSSDVPNQERWLDTIFFNKDWKFTDDSILVGHSAGATLILRILEKLPQGIKVNKAVLVAGLVKLGTKREYFPYKKDLVKNPFRWRKIKQSCQKFYFFHSDNDPYECGIEQGKILVRHLGGKLMFKAGHGHFNLEVGSQYREFPELLEKILD